MKPLKPRRPAAGPQYSPAHAHRFAMMSGEALQHNHAVEFYTYSVNGSGHDGHIHTYQGHTWMGRGHFHRFSGSTGPAIPLPDGTHIHAVHGELDEEPFKFKGGYYVTVASIHRHGHPYKGSTGTELGVEPADW